MVCLLATDGLALIVQPAQIPAAIPRILRQSLLLLVDTRRKGGGRLFIAPQPGQLRHLAQRINKLLCHHDALAFALAAKGAKMVVPVAEQDQGQAMLAHVLLGEVDAPHQMLPQACATAVRELVLCQKGNFFVQKRHIACFGGDGVSQIDQPQVVVRSGDILRRGAFFRPHDMYRVAICKLLGGQIFQHGQRPFRLAAGLCQQILGAVTETHAPHTGSGGADGAGIPGGVNALQRIPCVHLTLCRRIRELALIH